jgi:hypothetical protein
MGEDYQGIRNLLDQQDWEEIIQRLTKYANKLVAANAWLRLRGGTPPGGKLGEDYAMQAIKKLFTSESTGTRIWSPELPLLVFLKGIVRSDISTEVEGKENTSTIRPYEGFDAEKWDDHSLEEVMNAFAHDSVTTKVIELYWDGATDKEIKNALNIKRTELDRITKCLQEYFDLKTIGNRAKAEPK